ncbi:MAG: outer membrane protein assembly factor BamA, partial [Pseudohongiella nitratireducens]|nr:outer membrane protein assembly factor BamA [Pseudohongiella nitratireducens]
MINKRVTTLLGSSLLSLSISLAAQAQNSDSFIIDDIRIDGLQRISPGVMFGLLPISVGDQMQPGMAGQIIRSVTESQYFEEIEVAREGDV